MSYSFAIAGDARADLRALDPWLQEEILDELESLAADPSLLATTEPGGDLVYAFSRVTGGAKHYVSLTLTRNDVNQTLTVLGIFLRTLPLPPTA